MCVRCGMPLPLHNMHVLPAFAVRCAGSLAMFMRYLLFHPNPCKKNREPGDIMNGALAGHRIPPQRQRDVHLRAWPRL